MNAPSFEIFERKKHRGDPRAVVTISQTGMIWFSRASLAALGEPQFLTLLVDEAARLVGFRAAAAGDPNGYVVNARSMISGSALCRFLGLDLSETRRYALIGGKIPHIDLNRDCIPPYGRHRVTARQEVDNGMK